MAATIGTSDIEKNVKRASASGHVMVKGIVATPITGKAKFAPVDKDADPAFAIVTDSRGEKRVKRIAGGDKGAAEKAAMTAAMKNAGATVYLAQKVGSGEGGDVFKLLGSYKRA